MSPSSAELWFAGRKMDLTRKLSAYVGSNEKTKLVVVLQEQGDPRPLRERVSGNLIFSSQRLSKLSKI